MPVSINADGMPPRIRHGTSRQLVKRLTIRATLRAIRDTIMMIIGEPKVTSMAYGSAEQGRKIDLDPRP